jgi:cbb3-type cytochrome oxidase maturation protein
MGVMPLIILCSMLVAGTFLVLFIGIIKQGQYDDITTPAIRVTFDDEPLKVLNQDSDIS